MGNNLNTMCCSSEANGANKDANAKFDNSDMPSQDSQRKTTSYNKGVKNRSSNTKVTTKNLQGVYALQNSDKKGKL